MTFSYNSAIPAGANNPSNDQPIMLQNAQSISSIVSVDHLGFNVANGGYHTDIHMVPQSTPGAIVGIGQLFSKTVSGDTQLFYETGLGVVSQLTGGTFSSNGFVNVSGIILQWGTATTVGTGTPNSTVNFPLAFPNNCFNAQCTTSETTTNRNFMVVFGTSKTQLQATAINSNGTAQSGVTYFWFAIGN